jgi:hypothetical protein
LEGDEEAYTPRAIRDDAEGVVDARATGPATVTQGPRHTRRTLVRRALLVSDAWSLGLTFAIVHVIVGTTGRGFTSGKELVLFLLVRDRGSVRAV